uniref:Uncharacterized protein n=1 Tax=Siphoviridae sp. ctwuP1 TaxID=2827972 RepID=A0A8S5TAN6_9CAUD|nr:MAG TPA: hypothetical protein [Siphoviridae sp. ctwuP1]
MIDTSIAFISLLLYRCNIIIYRRVKKVNSFSTKILRRYKIYGIVV